MTIREINNLCRAIRGATISNRIQSALDTAIKYLCDDVPNRTIRWIVPMLRDLAVYSKSYGYTVDDGCAKALGRAADALCEHLDKGRTTTTLSNKLDVPDFEGLSANEAWADCENWEDWMYSHLSDDSEFAWTEALRINQDNYDRYYERYENE